MHRNTGRVNLNVARISEHRALAIYLNSSCTVATHGVGREEIGITIATRSDYNGISREAFELTCNEVLGNNTTSVTINDHNVFHFVTGVKLHLTGLYLRAQRRISTEQQLLTGLSLGIEGTAHLCATERTVGQHATIFTCERHALSHALVDDIVTHLSQTINIGLTSTVVTTLHGVIEKTIYGVAVVLIVLCGVNTTLCGDRVRTAWRVLDAEVEDVEAHLAECGGSRCTSQTRTDNNDVQFQFILWVNQALVSLVVGPLLSHRSFRYSGI